MKKQLLFFFLILSTLLVSCSPTKSPYLSITVTAGEGDQLLSTTYEYDLSTKKLLMRGQVPYTSQYPLTAVDVKRQVIYYTGRDQSGLADQLQVYDLTSKQSQTLTTDLFAINELFVIDKQVVLAASSKKATDNHIMPLASYDLDHKQFRFWWDPNKEDTTVKFAKPIPGTNRLYAGLYSFGESFTNLEKANQLQLQDGAEPPLYTVFEFDDRGNKIKKWFETKEELPFFALSSDQKQAFYSSATTTFTPRSYQFLELATSSKTPFTPFEQISDAFFEPGDQGLLLLGTYQKKRGVYRYDLQSKEVTLLMEEPSKAFINNFTLMEK
ncbi:hypothetical protein C0R09_10580 [Brevibacillus laterosporus]|uniref:hypothetical protein n=1 Tax=Brevibacillus TaxID=55080 RepID=UPI0002405177|nr:MULTISPECIES: hypothetical protein [Brevibacillus]AUM64944.1 hypothetical protein C0R09_10580 [Brevibacillus laterosporus]MCR8963701.1 hypothetical protein [Brevibacillus laterosporus]MCZ0835857.1 hypothetical protein [Brevibacillus halotolerans]CCF16284.1 putative lipoprotein [Brevibacillus laterosporus GI-9]